MENPNSVIAEVSEIKQYYKKNKNKADFQENAKIKFKDFEYKYPIIFKKIMENTLNNEEFVMMMNMMRKIQNDELTDHDASVKVGQHLVDKFVKPMLNKEKNIEKENIDKENIEKENINE